MGYKNTVLLDDYTTETQELLKRQAEVSFKMGAGAVIDWLLANEDTYGDIKDYPRILFNARRAEWNEKLKEWGA
jgi:hypothetical protein